MNFHALKFKRLAHAFFLLLICMSQVYAKSYAQKINIKAEGLSMEAFLEKIRSQSGYDIFYNSKHVRKAKPVTLDIRNGSLEEALKAGLFNQPFTYTIREKAVIIKPAPARDQAPEQVQDGQIDLTGYVKDGEGNLLPGASIRVKGSNRATVTDAKGYFELRDIDGDAVLVISYTGYTTQEVPLNQRERIEVVLAEGIQSLTDVVVVGYGVQKKSDVTGAISAVTGSQLAKAPVANVSSSLGGRVAGVIARSNTGQPGKDQTQIRIRGINTTGNAEPLVLVDGIPMDYNLLNMEDVENVTILKDASAVAPYGLAGANGVVLVTTRRGKKGAFSLTYQGAFGFQTPTAIPDYVDAYGYASTLNLANKFAGNPEPYSAEALEKYKNGSDPDHFPNTNWRSLITKTAPQSKHNLTFTGGSDRIRFFGSVGMFKQEGVASTINYKRYNISSNIDADLTKTTSMQLDLSGIMSENNTPGGISPSGIFNVGKETPAIFPIQYTNGMYANAVLPGIYDGGYSRTKENVLNIRAQLSQEVPFIPGLTLKGVYAYRKGFDTDKDWQLPVIFYNLNAAGEYLPQLTGPKAPQLAKSVAEYAAQTIQAYATYQRTFGDHQVDGLVVYEKRSGDTDSLMASRVNYAVNLDEISMGSGSKNDYDNSGSSVRWAQEGWVYRLNYGYKSRYLIGLSGRYDGHYYFAPGKRYAFFPAVSLGWRLSEESFIKNRLSWLDNLKIRGSYGKSGNLAGSPFQYLRAYGLRNSYVFGGNNPTQVQGIYEQAQANPGITWETAIKTDVGVDADFFGGRLGFVADYFFEKRDGMLMNPETTVPGEYGLGISQVNAGKMESKGFEAALTHRSTFSNGLLMNLNLNVSYARNKLIQTYETQATFNNPNRRRTGRPLNSRFGLESDGLYQAGDFKADGNLKEGLAVPTYGAVKPGDIKYIDQNNDGKIDINDETMIGKPLFPETIFGLNIGLIWKGVELNALLQGGAGSSLYLEGELAYPFFNGATAALYQLDYWTPENTGARYPRLTPSPTTNNSQISSYWIKNGAYARLKTLELAYTIPAFLTSKIHVKNARVSLSAQNLLTLSSFKYIDPELSQNRARYYFQQKVYQIGFSVSF
jgi:TonB-linked SusC/RagA family outer membrane protein